MTLHDAAFADLIAMGWSSSDAYLSIYLLPKTTATAESVKTKGRAAKSREEIGERIRKTQRVLAERFGGYAEPAEETTTGGDYSKENVLRQLHTEAQNADDAKTRIQAWEKIATINGLKKQESIEGEEPTRIYMPALCTGCSLFQSAVEKGLIKKTDCEKSPFKGIELNE